MRGSKTRITNLYLYVFHYVIDGVFPLVTAYFTANKRVKQKHIALKMSLNDIYSSVFEYWLYFQYLQCIFLVQ